MDPKKANKRTGSDKESDTAAKSNPPGNTTASGSEEISSDPILAEKDEVKNAEEKLRSKTNK